METMFASKVFIAFLVFAYLREGCGKSCEYGTMQHVNGSPACICERGYGGEDCSSALCVRDCRFPNATCSLEMESKGDCLCDESYFSTQPCYVDLCADKECGVYEQCVVADGQAKCICAPGLYGMDCSLRCDHCENGAHCLTEKWNGTGLPECDCNRGYTGVNCTQLANTCEMLADCRPGAYKCEMLNASLPLCHCHAGYAGDFCEHEVGCRPGMCWNGGRCLMVGDHFYRCLCPPEYYGANCEHTQSRQERTAEKEKEGTEEGGEDEKCSAPCVQVARNAICDRECNIAACYFDGGDCSGGVVVFSECPNAGHCFAVFQDSTCDWMCDNRECLFDGFDCLNVSNVCPRGEWCALRYGDGRCDRECDVESCGWDGGDCVGADIQPLAEGLVLIMDGNVEQFLNYSGSVLQFLSREIQASLAMEKDEYGPVMYKWRNRERKRRVDWHTKLIEYEQPTTQLSPRVRRSLGGEVEVWLSVWPTKCVVDCVDSAGTAGELLGMVSAKEKLSPFGLSLSTIRFSRPSPSPLLILSLFVAIVLCLVLISILSSHLISVPVWVPPPSDKPEAGGTVLEETPCVVAPSPLHEAAAGVSPLSGVDDCLVNSVDGQGRTPLHWLVANTSKHAQQVQDDVDALASAGANVNFRDNAGVSPLLLAVTSSRVSVARYLYSHGASAILQSQSGETCLHCAILNDDLVLTQWLLSLREVKENLNIVDNQDRTALMLSCKLAINSEAIASCLLAAGADVNFSGDTTKLWHFQGRTALHWAAYYDNIVVMKMLLEAGARVDVLDVHGCSPIFLSAKRGSVIGVEVLLEWAADRYIADSLGRTPLAIARINGHEDVVQLIQHFPRVTRGKRKATKQGQGVGGKRACVWDTKYVWHSSPDTGYATSPDTISSPSDGSTPEVMSPEIKTTFSPIPSPELSDQIEYKMESMFSPSTETSLFCSIDIPSDMTIDWCGKVEEELSANWDPSVFEPAILYYYEQ